MAIEPPKLFQYQSLAELFNFYLEKYVAQSPIVAACGCRIHCYEHHFVHLVKLMGPTKERIYFPEERARIMATVNGFGDYQHEQRRGVRLMATLETLTTPEMVVRSPKLVTGDRAFIKEFVDSQYPYIVVVVHRDNGVLALTTGQPTRRRNLKEWLRGEKLYPRTPQPPG